MYVALTLSVFFLLSSLLFSFLHIEDDDDDFEVSAGGKTKICLKRICILSCVCLCCAPLLLPSPLILFYCFILLELSFSLYFAFSSSPFILDPPLNRLNLILYFLRSALSFIHSFSLVDQHLLVMNLLTRIFLLLTLFFLAHVTGTIFILGALYVAGIFVCGGWTLQKCTNAVWNAF
jgi:hypothetical protein